MKQISTLFATLVLLLVVNSGSAQTYSVNNNASWKNAYSSYYISGASFVIASGATLTLDQAWTTAVNCSFSGGTVAITQNFTCQGCTFSNCKLIITNSALTLQSNTTSFTNVTGTVSGSSTITGSAPLVFTSSVFTFSGTSAFNPQQQLDLYSSTLNFYGNSYMLSTGGPDNLWAGSHLVAGDGTTTSKAYLFFNGATLNLEDAASSFALANYNNYYFNWSAYNSISNHKSYNGNSTINCGTTGKNACATPYTYGPITAGSNGIAAGFSSLPVVLNDFTVSLTAKNTVDITWSTQQEINSASFVIERSTDGAQWQAIGSVAAKGNSSVVSAYAYTDQSPLSSVNYYRLRMVDLDGSYTYSAVKLARSSVVKGISFFPNPATNYVNVSLSEAAASNTSIQLLTLSGQVLVDQKVSAGSNGIVTIPVQQYTRGMYVLRVASADGAQQTTKLMIAH